MKANFSIAASANIQRSSFDRSFNLKTTFDANYLVPIFCDEILPGDTFKLSTDMFCRLATPIKPAMDNLHVDTHFFFVPNRLVWNNWERFMGAKDNPDDAATYVVPKLQIPENNWTRDEHETSIYGYFGIPFAPTLKFNALPLRGYNLIFNNWFRDQNLQDSVDETSLDFDDYELLRRGKRHDYFTSCLTAPQKGEPVGLSLTGNAPVHAKLDSNGEEASAFYADSDISGKELDGFKTQFENSDGEESNFKLFSDMSDITAVTINALRQAFQLQKFLERDARGGTRYIEVIKSHFGVTNPDFRLQRPEYLGGTHNGVHITTIAQTAGTGNGSDTPQGNLAAMGTATDSGFCFSKSFTEHGFIIGVVSVYADLTYQDGLNKMWSRETRVDYFWPEFAHLGEQEVFNYEIYAQGTAEDNGIFGYQERYAEYRYKPNMITGLFNSNSSQSLDVWHYAQDFTSLPKLSSAFIVNDAPVKRNSAVVSEPDFLADFKFNLKCVRPMPMFGVPGWVDHF